jgi:hypothetical protein
VSGSVIIFQGMETLVSRRSALALGASALVLPRFGGTAQAAKSPVLVELFTSQGCSSCPPADTLAGELAKRDDVIVVSLNVDYWDYLGWKDTLAKPEFTKRQMNYAKSRGDGDVYTPQMVINGSAHVVGSNRGHVLDAVNDAAAAAVPIAISVQDNELHIDIGEGKSEGDATLWLMSVAREVSVDIERGENTGKTISYHNVVRMLTPAGMWKGKAESIVMPRKSVTLPHSKSCIAVLQQGDTGPVLGLGRWVVQGA